ncbi:MAG: tyrosine-type recombinase/integrase [Bacillota bacterium]
MFDFGNKRNKGIDITRNNKTMKTLLEDWLKKYAKPNTAATTYDGYKVIVKSHLIPYFKNIKVKNIISDNIQAYLSYKRKKGRKDNKEGGLSEKTLLQHYRVLSKVFDYAIDKAIIYKHPMKNNLLSAPSPKKKQNDIKHLSKKQLAHLLKVAKEEGKWIYNFIFVASHTGMRKSELLGLRWQDINFKKEELSVNKALVRKTGVGTIMKEPKTKASRRNITLSKEIIQKLKNQKKLQEQNKKELRAQYNNKLGLVFNKKDGSRYYPDTVNNKFNKVTKKAGLNKFGIHSLRHTHATIMYNENVPLKTIQNRLGHTTLQTTMDTYTRESTKKQREGLKIFQNAISKNI